MPRPSRAVGYRAVLRLPGVARVFPAAVLGRLTYAVTPLALLFTVEQATGSFAAAGAALGASGLTSLLMPIQSRLLDRFGQRTVLPVLAALSATALAGTAVAATRVSRPGWYVVLAVAIGLCAPPLGPSMRALWAALAPDPALRQRAYSLDGVVEEALYAVGPLVVGVALAVSSAKVALGLSGVLLLVGSLGMATSPVATRHGAPVPGRVATPLSGPFRQPGYPLLILTVLGFALASGPLDVAVAARAQQAGHPASTGYLLAALGVGSALGGLAWGAVVHRRRTWTHLTGLLAVAGVGLGAAGVVPTLPLLGGVLVVVGAAAAPLFVVAYLAADELVPAAGRTEATTWVNTANNLGVSVGAAAAGLVVERSGAGDALLAGGGVALLTAVGLAVAHGRLPTADDNPT